VHGHWGRGWLELGSGFMASASELAVPAFNGATVYGPFASEELAAALATLDASGLPYCLQARPGVYAEVAALARRYRLQPREPVPLMVCQRPPAPAAAPGLRIRELAPEEHAVHAAILADAFAAPLELSVALTPPVLLVPDNVWTLVGLLTEGDGDGRRVDRGGGGSGGGGTGGDRAGHPVATAFIDLHDGVGHLHNVGTRAAYRGRGFGAAISATATRIAFTAGADLVTLLSSPMGLGVYRRIGFHTAEHWSVWESPTAF
jgi:ribosomal protein S18 acetylase RimI-like enzyme